jgi:hypothetical protein
MVHKPLASLDVAISELVFVLLSSQTSYGWTKVLLPTAVLTI